MSDFGAAAGEGQTIQGQGWRAKWPLCWNRRQQTLVLMTSAGLLLTAIVAGNFLLGAENLVTNLELRNLSPSWAHPFGTDWLGRDMLTRTVKGLTLSLWVGLTAAAVSVFIAVVMGMAASVMGRRVDGLVSWLVDLFMSLPHLVTLILIAFAVGGGLAGVVIGVALTHWPSLTRIVRAEVLQLRSAEYVQISRHLGRSRRWVAVKHMLPHLMPQVMIGFLLLFPHAILHEAGITFLGFGLSPHQPAIGIILSESMRYLSAGMWWLAFFPGLSLLIMVRAFDVLGRNLRMLIDPHKARE